jgi:hypothetical protein
MLGEWMSCRRISVPIEILMKDNGLADAFQQLR